MVITVWFSYNETNKWISLISPISACYYLELCSAIMYQEFKFSLLKAQKVGKVGKVLHSH